MPKNIKQQIAKSAQKDKIKNPLPKKIKELTISLDISTNYTGFAFLMDGKPWIRANGMPSFGVVNMVKQESYEGYSYENGKRVKVEKFRNKEYATYGNRIFHGSYNQIMELSNILYRLLKPMNDLKGQNKFDIEKILLVAEISEIPNFGRAGQTITSTRKLALYVGSVLQTFANVFDIAGYHFKDKVLVKLVSPQDWQRRVGFTPKDREHSKAQSLKRANEIIKQWGFKNEITSDDTADALNLATVANEVRDSVFVRRINSNKARKEKQIIMEIAKATTKIQEYKSRAINSKNQFSDNVVWAQTVDRSELETPAERSRHTRYSKYSIEAIRLWEITDFLTPAQKRKYNQFTSQKQGLERELISMRKARVYAKNKSDIQR